MPPRFYLPASLQPDELIDLPAGAARHAQVLRLQPGHALVLFNGQGGEWSARVTAMGRSSVQVCVGRHDDVSRELRQRVTLAVGMPANDRMDSLVEKAGELGADVLQPLVCERSVLRLDGDRAVKKVAHWQAVAAAASEQSGRTRVLQVNPVLTLGAWLATLPPLQAGSSAQRCLLSLNDSLPWVAGAEFGLVTFLSGPEGGFSADEETLARRAGFSAVSLGPRVLRADTAPLAALVVVASDSAARTSCNEGQQ